MLNYPRATILSDTQVFRIIESKRTKKESLMALVSNGRCIDEDKSKESTMVEWVQECHQTHTL